MVWYDGQLVSNHNQGNNDRAMGLQIRGSRCHVTIFRS